MVKGRIVASRQTLGGPPNAHRQYAPRATAESGADHHAQEVGVVILEHRTRNA